MRMGPIEFWVSSLCLADGREPGWSSVLLPHWLRVSLNLGFCPEEEQAELHLAPNDWAVKATLCVFSFSAGDGSDGALSQYNF